MYFSRSPNHVSLRPCAVGIPLLTRLYNARAACLDADPTLLAQEAQVRNTVSLVWRYTH